MEQNILTPNQQNILLSAKQDPSITNTFYLTGGTALSYYYFQHRYSEDFDFFSQTEIDSNTLDIWAQKTAKHIKAEQLERQQLNGQQVYYFHVVKEVIKVDFAYYPFEHIDPFQQDDKLKIASIKDIGANKLHALSSRKRARDYLDLYVIATKGNLPIEKLIEGYRIKFDFYIASEVWATHFAGVLDASDLPRFLGDYKWKDVETYFTELAKKFAEKVLK